MDKVETGVMTKLLFVEDNPQTIKALLVRVEKEPNMAARVCGFAEATERIKSIQPDIVILDILIDSRSDAAGLDIRQFVWDSRFCPIVVYSARPDLHDELHESHPFIKSVRKGRDGPRKALRALKEFIGHVDVLKQTEEDVRQSFASVMRDVAPHAVEEDQARWGKQSRGPDCGELPPSWTTAQAMTRVSLLGSNICGLRFPMTSSWATS